MGSDVWMEQAIKCMVFAARFLVLKMGRTLVISVLVCLLILTVRGVIGRIRRVRLSSLYPYLKMYLWGLLFVAPFTGMIKISGDSLLVRRWLYSKLYGMAMYTWIPTAIYFTVVTAILAGIAVRDIRMRRKIKRMEVCPQFALGRRITVRRTPLAVTPFTTGFFRYTIVLPDCILEGCSDEEVVNVVSHEYIHITRGHLVFARLLQWCQILWFMNPLIHICARMAREDMEMICDRETIRACGGGSEQYGMVLIKSLKLIRGKNVMRAGGRATMGFASEQAFRNMRRRVGMIADYQTSRTWQVRALLGAALLVLAVLLLFVKSISYNSYTEYGEFSLYVTDKLNPVLKDRDITAMIEQCDEGLRVDNHGIKKLLAKEGCDLSGNYWIYYGGYMKLPGTGGGGDIVAYYPGEAPDRYITIPYNEQLAANRVLDWFLRNI